MLAFFVYCASIAITVSVLFVTSSSLVLIDISFAFLSGLSSSFSRFSTPSKTAGSSLIISAFVPTSTEIPPSFVSTPFTCLTISPAVAYVRAKSFVTFDTCTGFAVAPTFEMWYTPPASFLNSRFLVSSTSLSRASSSCLSVSFKVTGGTSAGFVISIEYGTLPAFINMVSRTVLTGVSLNSNGGSTYTFCADTTPHKRSAANAINTFFITAKPPRGH